MASTRDILVEKIKNLGHKVDHEKDPIRRRQYIADRLEAIRSLNEWLQDHKESE